MSSWIILPSVLSLGEKNPIVLQTYQGGVGVKAPDPPVVQMSYYFDILRPRKLFLTKKQMKSKIFTSVILDWITVLFTEYRFD